MADTKVVYNTRFVGRKPVDGPLNDFRLSEVVASLQKAGAGKEEDTRCSLELGDKNLTVTFTKKDEGFESDTESAKSVENSAVAAAGDKAVSGVEEKIIKDHVFRFEAGVDESYSSQPGSGSGSDSETSDHNKSSSGSSSASSSPTAELSKYKFDHLDTYSISDVLICHTDKVHKTCVVWVIRKTGALEALVFECSSEDNARQLYKKFHEVSKRSKLERHRRRKSDGGSIVTRGSDFGGLGRAADLKLRSPAAAEAVTINNIDTSVIEKAVEKNHQKWNLVQHTDKNGVTHIEVESSQQQPPASHLVTSAASPASQQPRSLVTFSPQFLARGRGALGGVGGVAPRPGKQQDRTKFAKELETILSGEVRRRGGEPADTRDPKPESARVPEPSHGRAQESLSLRQRAPALLLRKLDEFEEKAQKIWARAEQEEENRKVWSKSSASVIGITSPAPPGPQLDQAAAPTEKDRANQKTTASKEKHERVDNQKNQVVDKEKISASPAATSNHTSGAKSRHKDGGGQKKEGEASNRILVPTKTGKEPAKKLYPKESPPMFGGRFVALGPPGQLPLAQPHSLPLYPLQLPGGVAWGHTRFPAEMSQLDLTQPVWKFPASPPDPSVWRHSAHGGPHGGHHGGGHGGHGGGHGPHGGPLQDPGGGRSRSRDRGRADMEQRRQRAQSKSPARQHARPGTGARYMDTVNLGPDMSGLSRMFRELGGAVRAKMSKAKVAAPLADSPDCSPAHAQLKSNLKKQRPGAADPAAADSSPSVASSAAQQSVTPDNKKVHFNKFATVQMMG